MEGTWITRMRTKKPEGAKDWSWRERPYRVKPSRAHDTVYEVNIFPGVFDQGKRYTCNFCAMTSTGQMELNREVAIAGGDYEFRLQWESLVTKFLELNGLQPEDGPDARKKMEEDLLIGEPGSAYDLIDGTAWCFKHLGVKADCYKKMAVPAHGVKEEPACVRHLALHGYKRYESMNERDVERFVDEGRAVRTSIFAGDEFDDLQAGEIYAWCPDIDMVEMKWVQRPARHSIVLLGNGDTGPELGYLQYHPFLNSYGVQYGDGGMGCVFYKSLIGPYYLLDMKAKPKVVVKTLSQLEREGIPPPRLAPHKDPVPTPSPPHGRPLSRPRQLPIPTPPPHGRPLSPPRQLPVPTPPPHGRLPSQQGYVRPRRRNGWHTPPGGRASMNSDRWKD